MVVNGTKDPVRVFSAGVDRERPLAHCERFLRESQSEQWRAPTLGEAKAAVVVNATSGVAEGNAVQVFANGDAKRQLDVQPQSMLCFVDFGVLGNPVIWTKTLSSARCSNSWEILEREIQWVLKDVALVYD